MNASGDGSDGTAGEFHWIDRRVLSDESQELLPGIEYGFGDCILAILLTAELLEGTVSYRKAQRMIDTQAKGAFKLEEEPAKLRDSYGRRCRA